MLPVRPPLRNAVGNTLPCWLSLFGRGCATGGGVVPSPSVVVFGGVVGRFDRSCDDAEGGFEGECARAGGVVDVGGDVGATARGGSVAGGVVGEPGRAGAAAGDGGSPATGGGIVGAPDRIGGCIVGVNDRACGAGSVWKLEEARYAAIRSLLSG